MRRSALVSGFVVALVSLVSLASVSGLLASSSSSELASAVKDGNRAAVRAQLAKKVDVNAAEADGTTALHWAVRANDMETAQMLIRAGANVKAANHYNVTPMWLAATNGNAAMLEALMKAGADPKSTFSEGETTLMTAARTGIEAGADLDQADPDGISPIVVALLSGHYDTAGLLIQKGANVNLVDRTGRAPLFVAVDMHSLEWRFNRPAPKKFEKQYGPADIVKMLLEHGADVNAELSAGILGPSRAATGNRNLSKGSTPFLKAATTSDVEMMRLLLDWGADPYKTNQTHTNALLMVSGLNWQPQASIGPQDDAVEACQLLFDLGFDVNGTNDLGETALHGAAKRTEERDANKLIQFLVDHGANLYAKTKGPGQGGGAAAAAGGGGGRGGATPSQIPYDVSKGGLGEIDAAGNPSTRPANHRTMTLLEELMQKHPDPSKASAQVQ